MKKRKAIIIGTAVAIIVKYASSLLMLQIIGLFSNEKPCTEYAENVGTPWLFLMILAALVISPALGLSAGLPFVRRFGRDARWKISLGLIVSVMVMCALFSARPFQPAEYIFSCMLFNIPVLTGIFITHVIRRLMIRRKHHF